MTDGLGKYLCPANNARGGYRIFMSTGGDMLQFLTVSLDEGKISDRALMYLSACSSTGNTVLGRKKFRAEVAFL